jgi:hypothetical protein
MEINKIIESLDRIALLLDQCADDVPYELSAKESLYFRMVDAAAEARELLKEARQI